MAVNIELIKKMADIAALSIDVDEAEDYEKHLGYVAGYMEQQLSQIATDDIEPMEHLLSIQNVYRADEVTNSDRKTELISAAPVTEDDCYIVPSVVEPS